MSMGYNTFNMVSAPRDLVLRDIQATAQAAVQATAQAAVQATAQAAAKDFQPSTDSVNQKCCIM